jgi:tetratricopeptide (TPR) repeat protein
MGNRQAPDRAGACGRPALARPVSSDALPPSRVTSVPGRRPARARLICRCGALLLAAVCVTSPTRAQDVDGYLEMAREYASGQGDDATSRLAKWPQYDISAAAAEAALTASARDLAAVAMLHTDLANTIIDANPDEARFHIGMARAALQVASSRVGQRKRLEPFVRRWFRFVASVYTSAELLDAAWDHIQRGLDLFPQDPGLLVARGIRVEVAVRKNLIPDWRRGTVFDSERRPAVEPALKSAVNDYVKALAVDGHNAEAHLHLGWLRLFMADGRAKAELDAAVADSADDRVRYLAHLFLGGLAEREHHLEEARHEYDTARTVGPDFQTPYVALSRVEQSLGHDARARELALAALHLDKSDADDPWWDHRIGFDRESLYWLRDEVRRPQ